ncbi:MAG: aldehyde ferredoxin oxidoreductase N-terminal domain-containing protein [Candidatus Woesearchaeota archaeon]
MIGQKAIYINASTKDYMIEAVSDPEVIGPIDFGIKETRKDKNAFCFGSGALAGSIIPGTKRLIFYAFSPLWTHYYISTMGGAAEVFHKTGINYVCITGSCEKYSVMKLNRANGKIIVSFEEIDLETIWKGYNHETGTYALQQYCYDKYKNEFKDCRILVTGPAALRTNMGAIMSAPIVNGQITPVDCWAGRGGLGSKLLQDHKIAAIMYGGDFEELPNSPLKDMVRINKIFESKFQKNMIQEDMEATKKYRFDPVFNSGGTLGVNFTRIKGWMFSFNYQSVNFSDDDRLNIHKRLIIDHYLKQFNEESIAKKQWKHCGEPCIAVCKKMNGIYKKDYEPYEALGPNCGIFDQREAEKINHYADAMGFDAIQVGSVVSWIMECIQKNVFPKEDFDINMVPRWDFKNFDIINDSKNNADLGCQIIDRLLNNEKCKVFRQGLRSAAKEIDKKYGTNSINYAVFNAFGDSGCIVPNQYWVPGMFSPMPIMGKYFEYYEADFLPPYELGKKNVERMIKEIYADNTGICRFHRGWVEKIINDIVNDIYEINIDYFSHHKKITQLINLNNKPVFWESERVIDIIWRYLEKIAVSEPENPERDIVSAKKPDESLHQWVDRFRENKFKAAEDYWQLILDGINEGMR